MIKTKVKLPSELVLKLRDHKLVPSRKVYSRQKQKTEWKKEIQDGKN